MSDTEQSKPPPRNTSFGEFWFRRGLCFFILAYVLANTSLQAAMGAEPKQLLELTKEHGWLLFWTLIIYAGSSTIHDKIDKIMEAFKR